MRRILLAAFVVALAGPTAAQAATRITIDRLPSAATPDRTIGAVVRGFDWPVNEFCSRRVRVWLQFPTTTGVLAVYVGRRNVTDAGRFKITWNAQQPIDLAGTVAIARMRCESGKDGSVVRVIRTAVYTG